MKKRAVQSILFIGITCILFTSLVCKKNPVYPPDTYIPPDTTSQDFSVSTWEFGHGYATSYASDAWVFDRNNIWVVGLFQGIDSTNPQGHTDANIVRWDGVSWKPFNIFLATSSGFNSLFAVDTSLIYFSSGLLRKYQNGVIEPIYMPGVQLSPGQSIDYVWASDESNVWGVGEKGTIVHFDGSVWKKVSFNDIYDLRGICGSKTTGIGYAIGYNTSVREYIIVELKNDSAKVLYSDIPDRLAFRDVQMLDEDRLILCGTAVYTYSLSTRSIQVMATANIYSFIFFRIAVAGRHDVFVFGEQVGVSQKNKIVLAHYNGSRFTFSQILEEDVSTIYLGASACDNVAIFGTWSRQKALIISIRRN